MTFSPDMSLEEFIKLVEKYADEKYGSTDVENGSELVYGHESLLAEAEARKERMLKKNQLAGSQGWNLTDANIATIKQKVHTTGNLQVGKFIVKIKNYKTDKNKETTVTLDIHEEKFLKGTSMKMPQRVNVVKDIRFDNRPWLKYFTNKIAGGTDIPIKTAADIVRWCQAISKLEAFI